jgi:hypothetical protein
MKLTHLLATSTVLTLFLVPSASGGRRNSPQLAETVDLPATFNLDFALASKMRSEMGSVRDAPVNGDPGRVGQEVFSDLTNKEMVTSLGLPYRWTFSVLRSSIVNAISLPDGEVAAYRGLTQLIGTNRGLWAAVLSHEIAHVERRHAVRKALYHLYLQQQIEYYKMRPIEVREKEITSFSSLGISGLRNVAKMGRAAAGVLCHAIRIIKANTRKLPIISARM